MARSPEEKSIIEKGKLWQAFLGTEWGRELYSFFDEQERNAKETMFEQLIGNEGEVAQLTACKLAGILSVKSHIEDSITVMQQLENEGK